MDREYANEILACLPQERTCFHYFKDRYALQLLGYAAGDGTSVEALRRSRYARLLNKPAVRQLLANCGDGRLDRQRIDSQWQAPLLPFLLTVGLWGDKRRWQRNQTSRPGYNLVLRLNFSHDHDRRFERLFGPYYQDASLNGYWGHPVMKSGERRYYRQTLAWARLDVDLENGEALIEEIQTDWVREANDERRGLPACGNCKRKARNEYCHRVERARHYLDEVLQPYAAVWDEAMLSASLFFLREELGLSRVWYHTWHSGNALKGIGNHWAPPRSLYQTLPRRFCFGETDRMPQMLRNRASEKRLRRARVEPRFYQLDI
jgi:hypothetical protein